MSDTTTDHSRDARGRQYEVEGGMRYRISSTGRGSKALGPCEVCGKTTDDVFLQVSQRFVGGIWVEHFSPQAFGHEACLRSVRSSH